MNLFTHARLCKILSLFFALSNVPSYAFVSTNPQTHSKRSNLPQSLNMQSEKQPAHSAAFTRRELFKKSTILFPLLVPQLALASDCIGGCVSECMREIAYPVSFF